MFQLPEKQRAGRLFIDLLMLLRQAASGDGNRADRRTWPADYSIWIAEAGGRKWGRLRHRLRLREHRGRRKFHTPVGDQHDMTAAYSTHFEGRQPHHLLRCGRRKNNARRF
jgi:hypothetical protein